MVTVVQNLRISHSAESMEAEARHKPNSTRHALIGINPHNDNYVDSTGLYMRSLAIIVLFMHLDDETLPIRVKGTRNNDVVL